MGETFRQSISGQNSCSLANSEKLNTEVGKGDGVVETDTSYTVTPGERGSCGSGGDCGSADGEGCVRDTC